MKCLKARPKTHIYGLFSDIFSLLPSTFGELVRYRFYKKLFNSFGEGTKIGVLFKALNPQLINVGKNCSFNRNVTLAIIEGLTIGDGVRIAPNVVIVDNNHGYERGSEIRLQKHISKGIIIEKDVWIGANSTVTKGSIIREGSIIGANSLVRGEIPAYEVWGGVPAKFIKKRV